MSADLDDAVRQADAWVDGVHGPLPFALVAALRALLAAVRERSGATKPPDAVRQAEGALVPALLHMAQLHPLNTEHTDYWTARLNESRALLAAVREQPGATKPPDTCDRCQANVVADGYFALCLACYEPPAPQPGPRAALLALADSAPEPGTSFLAGAVPVAPQPGAGETERTTPMPCPFCGAAVRRSYAGDPSVPPIVCVECSYELHVSPEVWNRRVPAPPAAPEAVRKGLAAAEELLRCVTSSYRGSIGGERDTCLPQIGVEWLKRIEAAIAEGLAVLDSAQKREPK